MVLINPFITELDDKIVGYTDLQEDGYIDHLYGQAQGIVKVQQLFEDGDKTIFQGIIPVSVKRPNHFLSTLDLA